MTVEYIKDNKEYVIYIGNGYLAFDDDEDQELIAAVESTKYTEDTKRKK